MISRPIIILLTLCTFGLITGLFIYQFIPETHSISFSLDNNDSLFIYLIDNDHSTIHLTIDSLLEDLPNFIFLKDNLHLIYPANILLFMYNGMSQRSYLDHLF